jgi:hypothetical protein
MLATNPKDAENLGQARYFTGIACKRGHVVERYTSSAQCVMCARELSYERSLLPHVKEANARNKKKEEYRLKQQQYAKRNRTYSARNQSFSISKDMPFEERKRAYACAYYHANKNRMSKPDLEKRRVYVRQWASKYRKNPCGAVISFMRKCVQRCLANKNDRTEHLLGYNKAMLVKHLEAQFQDGMTWENYGQWHIDHIIPIKHFIMMDESDPKIINSLKNLRPLWASENLSKGAKHDALS